MHIILSVTPPDGGSLTSRLPTDEETGPFMTNLFRLVRAVEKLHPYQMHWTVWFLADKERITANVEVELLGSCRTSHSARLIAGLDGSLPVTLASASAGLSTQQISEEDLGKIAERIVEKLKKKKG